MGNISDLLFSNYMYNILIYDYETKTIREISVAWKEYKQPYVKQSTMAAYVLILENHILPNFGESDTLHEQAVQDFVLRKIENGLSVKSVKDILIVLKMVMKFGVKMNGWIIKSGTSNIRLLQQPKNWKYCQLPITRNTQSYSKPFLLYRTGYLHQSLYRTSYWGSLRFEVE